MYRFELWPRRARPAQAAYPVSSFQKELNDLFEDFFTSPSRLPAERVSEFAPLLNVSEADGAFRITFELPGLEEKDVEVSVDDNLLVVSGQKVDERAEEGEDRKWHCRERTSGSFRRALTLPTDADTEAIEATFKNGVLTVVIPRKKEPEASVRKIEVRKA